MNCWISVVVASSLLPLSSQLARFLKLPEGYYLIGGGHGPDANLNSASLKDCILKVTKEELATDTVTSYSFEASTETCYVYRLPMSIDHAEPGTARRRAVMRNVWFVKISDDIAYEGTCAEADVERIITALNAATSVKPSAVAGTTMSISTSSSLTPTTTMWKSVEITSTLNALTAPLYTSAFSLGTTPATNAASATMTRPTTKVPSTKQITPKTLKPTTTLPKCLPVNPNMHASIIIDSSSPLTVTRLQAQASASCLCNMGTTVQRGIRREFYPSGVTSKPSTIGAATNPVTVECKNKGYICIVAENGTTWIQGSSPPDHVAVYPYCEAGYGCHMYLAHFSNAGGGTTLQSGNAVIGEATYWTKSQVLKDIGFKSDYIKAAAISCGGCANIKKYKSFTCDTPAPAD